MGMSEYQPKIMAFLCNWCTYISADFEYSPHIRIIRLKCTGAVDTIYILKALIEGADGVLIVGCHPGDCHYQTGNYKARRRIAILKTIVKGFGFDGDRIWLKWMSAAEGKVFTDTVTEMVHVLKEKGPHPMKQLWMV
jgi:F420-non-reducing hydrogenase iron-sulfur subunit